MPKSVADSCIKKLNKVGAITLETTNPKNYTGAEGEFALGDTERAPVNDLTGAIILF